MSETEKYDMQMYKKRVFLQCWCFLNQDVRMLLCIFSEVEA